MYELNDKVGASVNGFYLFLFIYSFLSKNKDLTCQEYGKNDKIINPKFVTYKAGKYGNILATWVTILK